MHMHVPSSPPGQHLFQFLQHEVTRSISNTCPPPRWDASPSQGYPQHLIYQYLFIHLWILRHRENKSVLPNNRIQCYQPGLEPRLLEIEQKYKNPITGYLHRLLITFKMQNNLLPGQSGLGLGFGFLFSFRSVTSCPLHHLCVLTAHGISRTCRCEKLARIP